MRARITLGIIRADDLCMYTWFCNLIENSRKLPWWLSFVGCCGGLSEQLQVCFQATSHFRKNNRVELSCHVLRSCLCQKRGLARSHSSKNRYMPSRPSKSSEQCSPELGKGGDMLPYPSLGREASQGLSSMNWWAKISSSKSDESSERRDLSEPPGDVMVRSTSGAKGNFKATGTPIESSKSTSCPITPLDTPRSSQRRITVSASTPGKRTRSRPPFSSRIGRSPRLASLLMSFIKADSYFTARAKTTLRKSRKPSSPSVVAASAVGPPMGEPAAWGLRAVMVGSSRMSTKEPGVCFGIAWSSRPTSSG